MPGLAPTRFQRSGAAAFAAALSLSAPLVTGASPSGSADDVLFADGRVVDGSGAPAFRGDVAIRGDRIAFVGPASPARRRAARRFVDASGLVVAPGFVDLLGQSEYAALVDRRAASKITQGITTEVTGEGTSIAPLSETAVADGADVWKRYGLTPSWRDLAGYVRYFESHAPALNLGTFVGLGGLREAAAGKVNRPLSPAERDAVARQVARAMEEGALGVSTSLQYVPDMFATTDEIVEAARVAARYGGVWFTHQRSEANEIDASLDETFRIAREAGIPVNVWHLKTAYRKNWGRMPAVLERFEKAREAGLDVAANQYPWTAASNGLDACLPPWIREGGREKLLERLRDPAARERVKTELERDGDGWSNQWFGAGGASGVLLTSVLDPSLKKWEGKRLDAIGREMGEDPRDALMDLVLADRANSYCITFIMSEEDVRAALRHRLVAFCTDSSASAEDGIFSKEKSHPRAWGSATRILGTYVRDERVLPLEEAVRKMTSFPASRANLRDRGLLREGLAADVTAFDPKTVRAVSTFEDPNRYSEGVRFVLVNGRFVVDGGAITPERPGRFLRGPGTLR